MIRVVGKSNLPELAEMGEEVVLSPEELAEANRRHEIFERNVKWYQEHWDEIVPPNRGLHICIAGGKLFVGPDPIKLRADSAAEFPEEKNCQYTMYLRASAQGVRV
jgi:hypothetical protein